MHIAKNRESSYIARGERPRHNGYFKPAISLSSLNGPYKTRNFYLKAFSVQNENCSTEKVYGTAHA